MPEDIMAGVEKSKVQFVAIKDPNTEWICDQCATAFDLLSDPE